MNGLKMADIFPFGITTDDLGGETNEIGRSFI